MTNTRTSPEDQPVDMKRRTVLQAAALTPVLAAVLGTRAAAEPLSDVSEIRIIQKKDPGKIVERVSAPGYAQTLAAATLAFLADAYPGSLPIWKQPLSQIDMQSRISEIARHVVQAVVRYASTYPVDPCWIMAQIMAESFFYEFAVSSALAVGPCQFIALTAKGYGLICADEHLLPPGTVLRPDLEPEFQKTASLREQIRALRKTYSEIFTNPTRLLRSVLTTNASGRVASEAASYLAAMKRLDLLQSQQNAARDKAKQFLDENFQNRSIFNPQDIAFFEQFEQRVLYSYSIHAMIRLMSENLRTRNGNILAATAGYNAGMGNTGGTSGVYALYGKVPNFAETVDYVSKILINHYEIARRM